MSNKLGTGANAPNGTLAVVAPENMGKGLHWNDSTDQYEVKIAEKQPIKLNDNGELEFRVSNLEDNLLKIRDGMLYVGTKADVKVENLFVDAVNGVDQDPYKVDGAGTRAKPLRTLHYALSLREQNTQNWIWLKEDQDHIVPTVTQTLKRGVAEIRTYGDYTDSLLREWNDWYQVYRVLLEQRKEARIVFQGVKTDLYNGPLENFMMNKFMTFRLLENTSLWFYGVGLVADLSFNMERVINKSQYPSRITVVDPMYLYSEGEGNAIYFQRTRFSSRGTPRVIDKQAPDMTIKEDRIRELKQKGDNGLWELGFTYMKNGNLTLRSVIFDDSLDIHLISGTGWHPLYGSGLILTAQNEVDQAKVVKHTRNKLFEDLGNGVKRLLVPSTNIPTLTWL